MALQTSGAISISQIRSELGSSSGSLRTLSAAAGKSTPDAMSEFYGYSNFQQPTLTTTPTGSYSGSTLTMNGNITSAGSETILERGFYYVVSTSSSGVSVGTSNTKVTASGTSTGSFSATASVTASTSSAKYAHFRSFVRNNVGTYMSGGIGMVTIPQASGGGLPGNKFQ